MIICPACQHENIDGTQFCEMCGEELPQATVTASAEDLVKCPQCGHENPSDNLACEACGAELQAGAVPPPTPVVSSAADPFADIPDAGLAPPLAATPAASDATAPVSALAPGFETTPFDTPVSAPDPTSTPTPAPAGDLTPGSVKLVVEQGQTVGAQFVLGDAEMLVGREDEDEEIYPDIDLSDQDAGYVHRRHATIKFENGNLFVTHLGGSNKTRINNKPVGDDVPTPFNLGDKVAFGKVVLRLLPV